MVGKDVITAIVQCSCCLSMVGSAIVALTWAYPVENRKKHGRILLFWLSITDFFSSLVYFLQTFGTSANTVFCQTSALLGILFPVASFLWTDFIAYYLYLVVYYRTSFSDDQWKSLLFRFHAVAWSVSIFIVIFVSVFHHAGNNGSSLEDDGVDSNTGGWCWITANSAKETFIWEVIGGKFVEWTSCLIVLPYLYTSVGCKLYNLDVKNSSRQIIVGPSVYRANFDKKILEISHASNNSIPAMANGTQHKLTEVSSADKDNGSELNPIHASENNFNSRESVVSIKKSYFSRFYLKLALLPLVFLFVRFWSSLRIVLAFSGAKIASNNGFLLVMQAFFDPSQGFFNSLLFVVGSKTDRVLFLSLLKKFRKKVCKKNIRRILSNRSLYKVEESSLDSQMNNLAGDSNQFSDVLLSEVRSESCFEDDNPFSYEFDDDI